LKTKKQDHFEDLVDGSTKVDPEEVGFGDMN
jgi:hypothetical protein